MPAREHYSPDCGSRLNNRFTEPAVTALRRGQVFAALFNFLLIGGVLRPRQLLGCGLILAGMVVAEMRRGD